MKFKLITRNITIQVIALSMLLFSNAAFAEVQICLTKEVSNDGINWVDANLESEALLIDGTAYYRFTASKCLNGNIEDSFLEINNITLTDNDLNLNVAMNDLSEGWGVAPSVSIDYEVPDACLGLEGAYENIASVEGFVTFDTDPRIDTDNAWMRCDTPVIGGEGCTPGYWKQPQHLDSWGDIDPATKFSDVFDFVTLRVKDGNPDDPTLLEALSAKGGKVNMAARHAVAAYLNAMNSNVQYDLSTDAIIEAFVTSHVEDNYGTVIQDLVNFNEQGCPLN